MFIVSAGRIEYQWVRVVKRVDGSGRHISRKMKNEEARLAVAGTAMSEWRMMNSQISSSKTAIVMGPQATYNGCVKPAESHTLPQPSPRLHGRDAVALGTLCGFFSAFGYMAANICLRAVAHCDPIWVSCVKTTVTVALLAPWLIVAVARGQQVLPRAKVLVLLIGAAVFGHLAGNVAILWSLGVVGLAMAIPLSLGTMIFSGAVMGRVFLAEPITSRAAISIILLVAAVAVFSHGAQQAHHSVYVSHDVEPLTNRIVLLTAGVAAACLSGLAYAVLGVAIRYSVTGPTSLIATPAIVALVGVLLLGGISLGRFGAEVTWSLPQQDLAVVMLAGVCNAVAFLALAKALQLTTIIYVNGINASQAAMAALAGVLLFREALSIPLVVGVVLSIAGLLLMKGCEQKVAAARSASSDGSYGPAMAESVQQKEPTPSESTP